MFNLIDTDGDGSISRDEFSKVAQIIRASMFKTHKQETQAEEAAKQTARVRRILFYTIFAGLFLLAGNCALGYMVYKLTRDTSVESRDVVTTGDVLQSGAAVMTDRSNHVVQTGQFMSAADPDSIIMSGDSLVGDRVSSIHYESTDNTNKSSHVVAWSND